MTENPNQQLLDEVNATGAWFHARKTRPIWARQVEQDATVETLEGTEVVKPGDFLCRGIAGERWPQSAERLNEKYNPADEVDNEGWRKFIPKPDNEGVLAARIDHVFSVVAKWGVLSGKPGDYLVKDYKDQDDQYPEDIWIVDARLFEETYEVMNTD